jgi:hypothetical protein
MPSTYPSPAALATPNVTNASVAVAVQNLQRLGLFVFNPSATVTLWVAPAPTAAVANGAGSVAIQPLQGQMFGQPGGPPGCPAFTSGMNAIASAAGTNAITVWEFYP